jgi:hypothetical protein
MVEWCKVSWMQAGGGGADVGQSSAHARWWWWWWWSCRADGVIHLGGEAVVERTVIENHDLVDVLLPLLAFVSSSFSPFARLTPIVRAHVRVRRRIVPLSRW